ncbi:alpha/beta hydrolase family protein [Litoreibacter ponti]|uniref:Alpha/beta hydrolase family protein n=1 Tax=Litoreibacter ponti TaxID=1510457 RepID=A0A2T6BIR0_9RHOB|nr:alpha/beta hydrolase fold domain-containing protein [Litoreibacter ponti]PTX55945.1 alpha/beta hydrolase family protein [Litoreibacter ponti]
MDDRAPDFLVEYRSTLVAGEKVPLHLEIFAPDVRSVGTVLFFHSGGFMGGSYRAGRKLARDAVAQDLTFVSVEYRLKAKLDALTSDWAPQVLERQASSPKAFKLARRFSTAPALAATEDGLAALRWIEENRLQYGLGAARQAILGISAGGIVAANMSFLAPAMGVARPPVSAVSILSGALPNLSLCDLSRGPALQWLHGRGDERVSVNSAIAVADEAEGRAPPTDMRVFETKQHGVWLYRRRGLPGSSQAKRRSEFWTFLRDNIALDEL